MVNTKARYKRVLIIIHIKYRIVSTSTVINYLHHNLTSSHHLFCYRICDRSHTLLTLLRRIRFVNFSSPKISIDRYSDISDARYDELLFSRLFAFDVRFPLEISLQCIVDCGSTRKNDRTKIEGDFIVR